MNTRCPAWCDRILMSHSAKELILKVSTDLQPRHGSTSSAKVGRADTLLLVPGFSVVCSKHQAKTAYHGSNELLRLQCLPSKNTGLSQLTRWQLPKPKLSQTPLVVRELPALAAVVSPVCVSGALGCRLLGNLPLFKQE